MGWRRAFERNTFWQGIKRGAASNRLVNAAWDLRFEILAAIATELAWMAVRAVARWLFAFFAPSKPARILRLVPRPV